MINLLSKAVVAAFATLVSLSLIAPGVSAGSRYATPPPLVLSPDLTQPLTLQLRGRNFVVPRTTLNQRKRKSATKSYRKKSRRNIQRVSLRRTGVTTRKILRSKRATARPGKQFDRALLPTIVNYSGSQKPGTIIVNTAERRLYLVMANGKARRYGVGVGREGFQWRGTNKISRKAEWPSWRPPASMIAREKAKGKYLPSYMPGGLENPLGARAMYLGSTLYRIHGTTQNWSIGKAVSSGCIRMRNQDVMDLYDRVGTGTKVVVL